MKKPLLFLAFSFLYAIRGLTQCNPDTITGLIAKWNFDGNANDLSGNGHNGAVIGADQTSNRCSVANSTYYFDGIGNNQYIDVPNSADLNLSSTDYTISAWIKSDYITASNGAIIVKRNGSFLNNGYFFSLSGYGTNQHLSFEIAGGAPGSSGLVSNTPIDTSRWNHVVVTYNSVSDTMKIYINSTLDTVSGNIPSPTSTNSILRIGNDSYIGSYEFHGKIDDIRIYSRVLDPCAIHALYNQSCYTVTYRFIGNGNWSINSNWLNNQIPPTPVLTGTQVIISPLTGGECNVDIPITIQSGASLKIIPTSKFRVSNSLLYQH